MHIRCCSNLKYTLICRMHFKLHPTNWRKKKVDWMRDWCSSRDQSFHNRSVCNHKKRGPWTTRVRRRSSPFNYMWPRSVSSRSRSNQRQFIRYVAITVPFFLSLPCNKCLQQHCSLWDRFIVVLEEKKITKGGLRKIKTVKDFLYTYERRLWKSFAIYGGLG